MSKRRIITGFQIRKNKHLPPDCTVVCRITTFRDLAIKTAHVSSLLSLKAAILFRCPYPAWSIGRPGGCEPWLTGLAKLEEPAGRLEN